MADSQTEETGPAGGERRRRQARRRKSGSSWAPLVIILLLLVAAGAAIWATGGLSFTGGGAVAEVNGETIERSEFEARLARQTSAYEDQGIDVQGQGLTDQVRQQVLTGLIDQTLLLQAALEAGVEVSDEEVDTALEQQIQAIGGEEEFQSRLEEFDLTRTEVRDDLRVQLIVEKYADQASGELTASSQEIQALYGQYVAQLEAAGTTTDSTPSLDELRPQLEQAVIQQKQQQVLQQLLAQARQDAEVGVLVEGVQYPPQPQQPAPANAPTGQQPATPPAPTETPETGTTSADGESAAEAEVEGEATQSTSSDQQ